MNAKMIERTQESGGIRSPEIAAAFLATPRHRFLPGISLDLVYSGMAVVTRSDPTLGITSSSSEVGIMAPMLEALALEPGLRLLELGAGSGYNAALLDHLVGPAGEVVTIDVQPDVADEARRHLAETGHDRVRVVVGDGFAGYPERAPYDRIIATASVRDIPIAWRDQLREGGLLVVPLRLRPGAQIVVTLRRRGAVLEGVSAVAGGFMPLRTEGQPLESPLTVVGDWEVGLLAEEPGDAEMLSKLLGQEPEIETFPQVPWYVMFSLIGLAEADWISVRQRQRGMTWTGLIDRASKSVALLTNVAVPMTSTPRFMCLVYGSGTARDRLKAVCASLGRVRVDQVRVSAIPKIDRPSKADVVIEGDSFRYVIDLQRSD